MTQDTQSFQLLVLGPNMDTSQYQNKVRLNKRGILWNQYSYKFHFYISTSISTVQQNSITMDYYQIAHVKSFTIWIDNEWTINRGYIGFVVCSTIGN